MMSSFRQNDKKSGNLHGEIRLEIYKNIFYYAIEGLNLLVNKTAERLYF